MNKSVYTVFFFVLFATMLFGQKEDPVAKWDHLRFLIGEWTGEGEGQPGMGEGASLFSEELNNNIIVRKNHADFPEQNGRPAFRHEDLMIISQLPGRSISASYYDNEGHTINYSVDISEEGSTISFLSNAADGMPLFRMTYKKLNDDKLIFSFEIAQSGNVDDLAKYISSTLVRSK